MKPVILVSTGYNTAENGQNRRYLYQAYGDAITRAGGIPLIPLDNGELADDLYELCDGLLLTGGPDFDPALYGQEMLPECGALDTQRDSMEWKLLKRFEKGEKPIFGICRGLQIINCYFGGTLWQDLPSQCGVVHSGGHTCVHKTKLVEGTLLHRLYGDEMTTNSYHHQAIDRVAEGFRVVATAEDGTIEALSHETLPIGGTQWHPERMTGVERFEHHGPDSAPIFAAFIESCKK